MKASELIEALKAMIAEHGDLRVTAWPYDGQYRPLDVESVEVGESDLDTPLGDLLVSMKQPNEVKHFVVGAW